MDAWALGGIYGWMCAYIHVLMNERMDVGMCVCSSACADVWMQACVDVGLHDYIRTSHNHTCLHTSVRLHSYLHDCSILTMHAYSNAFLHAHARTPTCIHPYIQTCVHPYMHAVLRAYIYKSVHTYIHLLKHKTKQVMCQGVYVFFG